jgi:YD repeat-containing protein
MVKYPTRLFLHWWIALSAGIFPAAALAANTVEYIPVLGWSYNQYYFGIVTSPDATGHLTDGTGGKVYSSPDLAAHCKFIYGPTAVFNGNVVETPGGEQPPMVRGDCLVPNPYGLEPDVRQAGLYKRAICPWGSNPFVNWDPYREVACSIVISDSNPSKWKNSGHPSCGVTGGTNPVNIFTGNKFQKELDYTSNTAFPLKLERYYNSDVQTNPEGGANWRNNYSASIVEYSAFEPKAAIRFADNKMLIFTLVNGVWKPDADVLDKLTQLLSPQGTKAGWTYTSAKEGVVQEFDESGRLLSIRSRSGVVIKLSYSNGTGGILYHDLPAISGYLAPNCPSAPKGIASTKAGLLSCATHSFGQTLQFEYDESERLALVRDPKGGEIKYGYEGDAKAQKLSSVTYQDGAVRRYVYNENIADAGADTDRLGLLTGIIDENNGRFATWAYDASGRAISSEHGQGADKRTISYSTEYLTPRATVVDGRGSAIQYSSAVSLGVANNAGQSQAAGSGCPASSSATTFDANGNPKTVKNFNGVTTVFSYDIANNLELSRVEASGTPSARTNSTEWDLNLRLPKKIAEPKRLRIYAYDAKGNLLSTSEQATSDPTGASAFAATPTGAVRVWSYTYNDAGQLLTATDPNKGTMSYSYDTQGNLVSVKNAAGHITTLSDYDANGRVGKIVSPNNLVTTLAYSPRGWLLSRTVGNQTTSYQYDAVGQVTKVTAPDNSALAYTYDDAHRLTDVADNMGNRIHYTLDPLGNRIKEEVSDASGVLAQQVSRAYDALNRLQEITGGVQ